MTNALGINMEHFIPFYGSKIPRVITHMRAGHGMTRKESRNAPVPKRVWYTTDYTPVGEAILQPNELHEGGQKLKVPYAGPRSQTHCIDFDMTEYVIHWTKAVTLPILLATGLADNGWKIKEAGFMLFEVKNEIFFHRVMFNHNQFTNSPQYDAVRVRSSVKIRTPPGKEICIVIKLSTLVETLPNEVFLAPTGIFVVSHGPNVNDYDRRFIIPANKFHAIQIGTHASTNPGVSYLLNELSRKGWSDQVNLILTQLSIPSVSAQDIETVHQYAKGFMTNCDGGFVAEMSTELLSILAKDEPSKHYVNAQVPNRAPPKGTGKSKDKSKDASATPGTEGLALHTPIFFPEGPYLQPDIPLYSPQQYWEDLVNGHCLPPDFRDHNKIRCAYNTDSIEDLYDGKIRHLPRKVRIRPTRESWTFHRFSRQTRIAEEEMAVCLNTSICSSSIRIWSWYG